MYAMYMSSLGTDPNLFPQSGYISKYYENPPADYEIPPAYLEDETVLRGSLRKRKSMSVFLMCGAAAARKPLLIAAVLLAMC